MIVQSGEFLAARLEIFLARAESFLESLAGLLPFLRVRDDGLQINHANLGDRYTSGMSRWGRSRQEEQASTEKGQTQGSFLGHFDEYSYWTHDTTDGIGVGIL
ncbi:MAG TPA: hypothetical protein VHZ07_28150 [Bryobacteraceae bacterium]|nr:hypothetical protein [Bryobacteraceae bacterium]